MVVDEVAMAPHTVDRLAKDIVLVVEALGLKRNLWLTVIAVDRAGGRLEEALVLLPATMRTGVAVVSVFGLSSF